MEAVKVGGLDELELDSFGQRHFGAVELGDKRLTRRAVITADALMRHPAGTLPGKLAKRELLSFYDFANNAKVTHEKVLSGHRAWTREQMQAHEGVVLVIHDTTEADFSGLSAEGLGPIGNGGCSGLLLHNVLAVDGATGEAMGLVEQLVHGRRVVGKGESAKRKREHPGRESRLWVKGVESVGAAPAGKTWVNLMDRGGDSFECLERQQQLNQKYVVRSKSNRRVQAQDKSGRWIGRRLHDWARNLPSLGKRTLDVQGNKRQVGRRTQVSVGCGKVRLMPPHPKRGEHGNAPLEMWVVCVKELDPPPRCEALEWILLSNVEATQTRQPTWRIVDWYERRPIIEEFHKGQKTGCGMEEMQFTTRKALETGIAMLSVVAVQLLRLRDLSRRADAEQRQATEVIDEQIVQEQIVQVLSLWRFKQPRTDLSVKEFLYALARLGGHLGRTHDHPPGWLVLWRGWMKLQPLVEGARLMRLKRSA